MNNSPFFSVIVPVYNVSQYLKRCIDSILSQSYGDFELLLVDDVCTSGNTLASAYNLLKEHPYKIEALVLCAHQRFVNSCNKNRWKRKGIFSIL